MINRALIKQRAREQLDGKLGIFFLTFLIIGLITGLSAITVVGTIIMPIIFHISLICMGLKCFYRKELKLSNCFDGFSYFGKALWLRFITQFFISCWSLLFVIPGIVKTYAYSMAPYILADNPHMTAREALNESKRITYGHKADIFVMDLSFIGWGFLTAITGGILGIYVAPYLNLTYVNLYKALSSGMGVVEGSTPGGRKTVCSNCRRTLLPGEVCDCISKEAEVFVSTHFCVHCGKVLHAGEVCTCTMAPPPKKHCRYCGRPLFDGEICNCTTYGGGGVSEHHSHEESGLVINMGGKTSGSFDGRSGHGSHSSGSRFLSKPDELD